MERIKLQKEIERRELINSLCPFPVYDTEIIDDLKKREFMITKKGDYNSVPVEYCKTCLSLNIKNVEFPDGPGGENRDVQYCVPCGNSDLGKVHIEEWEEIYKERYKEKFLNLPEGE